MYGLLIGNVSAAQVLKYDDQDLVRDEIKNLVNALQE